LGSADIALALDEGALSFEADVPSLNASGRGRFGLVDDTSFDLVVDLQRTPLERLLEPTAGETPGPDVSGVGSLHVTATGDRTTLPDSQMTLELVELDGRVGTARLQLSDPGTIRYSDRTFSAERFELRIDDTQVALFGSVSDAASEITGTVTGELADLTPMVELARGMAENSPAVDLNGSIDAQVLLTGSLDAPDLSVQLRLRDGSVAVGTFSSAENLELDVSYDTQTVRLDRLRGTWQGAVIDGVGELPVALLGDQLPPWLARSTTDRPIGRLSLTADAISREALAPFVDPASLVDLDIDSSAQLDIEISGLEMEQVRAELRLSRLDMAVAGVPITQRRATHFDLVDGQLHVRAFDWGNEDDYLTVGGTVDLRGDTAIDLTITSEGDLRAISAFTTGIATEGNALLIANVTGPLSEPEVNGALEVSRAGFRLADPQVVVSDVNGALFLTRDSIQFHDFTGEANGGPLEITGVLDLVGLRPVGDVHLLGRGLAMNVPEGVRTELDTDLTLTASADDLALTGTVTVLRGAYRETLTLTGGILAALQEQESVTIVGLDEPSVLDAVGLNIRVVTAEDIVVDNNYVDATIGFDLRVVGSAGTPTLAGRARLGEGGRLQLGSRVYEVETGTVDFIDPTGIEPELNITARTRVSGRDISVTITGVPEALTTSFQSDPAASESDIVSLLLTGRTLDQARVAPQTAAAEQALGLVSTEFLGTTGRAVGLDTLSIGQDTTSGQIRFDSSLVASETDPGARLTVGKNLSDQVQVIVSQDLVESGQLTWIVEYLPRTNVELRFVLDDFNDRSYEFRHALALGGPERRSGAATNVRRVSRVDAIEFSGEPGLAESELRRRLDLRVGDQFDFYRWQQDRDELESLYAERDYLEAQVRPQRVETADGGSILTFNVVRGPRALLTIEGFQLPQRVSDQMKDTWTRAVFDGFLLEELETQARDYLGDIGFLQAEITAEVQASSAEQKEIVLQIESGPRTRQRDLVFQGNDRLTTAELRTFIARQGLEQSVWADPDPLITSLSSLYRSRGMLEVRVTTAPPEFDADEAVLAIIVVEGPLFAIASISIDGVEARPAVAVESVVRLDMGDIYSGLDVADARARIDQGYRQAGFNEVRVVAQSTVDLDSDTVAVVFEIDEGPRQVIREIDVVGGEHTQASLVSRALRISPGQPVDVGEWNQARKRLYDTGAFRSVDIEAQALDPETVENPEGEQPVRATVFLEEWPAYRLRYGVQVKDEEVPIAQQSNRDFSLGLVGDLTRQNFAGRAVTLGTAFRWDRDTRAVRGFARVPTFFDLPITSNVFISQEHSTFGDPDFLTATDQTLLTLEQRFKPRPSMTVAYGYTFEWNHTFDVAPDPDDPFGGFDEAVNIARLTAGAIIDTRNDLFDAARGWFHSSNVEYAPDSLGSQLRFIKYSGQQFHYWPLGSEVVLASAARIGLAAGFDQELILSERFFAGGGNTVRGYRRDSLGPLFFGQPDGGNASIVLNQEVRFPIFRFVRGVGFLDAGNVFSLIEDITLTNLKVGAGVGLRLDTPFGLFRFDFAAPLSEIEENRKSRFFFSIGQVF
jgi:outer membrane protein assembly complex protein YaeT